MENVELKSALKVAMQISSEGNSYMQKNEPWNKAN
jgi:methionyl-tRNA synthetase